MITDSFVTKYASGVPWIDGSDGTRIYLGGIVPEGAGAWTFGNNIIISQSTIDAVHDGRISLERYRALIIHEYVHVLQYRKLGASFLPSYFSAGVNTAVTTKHLQSFGNNRNPFESPAYRVEELYTAHPRLPAPWVFWH